MKATEPDQHARGRRPDKTKRASDPPGAVPGGHRFTELFLVILRSVRLYEQASPRKCEETQSMSQCTFKRMYVCENNNTITGHEQCSKVRGKRESTHTTARESTLLPPIQRDPKDPPSRQRDVLTMTSIPESRFSHTVPCLLDMTLNAPLSALVISLPYMLLPSP